MSENQTSGVVLSGERLTICMGAATELSVLAHQLPDFVPLGDEGGDGHHYIVRGIAARIVQLNSIIIDCLIESEEMVSNACLNRRLFIS